LSIWKEKQKERIKEIWGDIFFIFGILNFFINGSIDRKIKKEKMSMYLG